MLATVQSSKCRLGEEMLSDEMVHQELLGEVKRRLQRRRFHQMHVSDFIVLSSCLLGLDTGRAVTKVWQLGF